MDSRRVRRNKYFAQSFKGRGLTISACGALVDGQAMKQELLGATSEAPVTAQA